MTRVTHKTLRAAKKLAKERNMTVSDLVRVSLQEVFKIDCGV